jgi:hypothetical protein
MVLFNLRSREKRNSTLQHTTPQKSRFNLNGPNAVNLDPADGLGRAALFDCGYYGGRKARPVRPKDEHQADTDYGGYAYKTACSIGYFQKKEPGALGIQAPFRLSRDSLDGDEAS